MEQPPVDYPELRMEEIRTDWSGIWLPLIPMAAAVFAFLVAIWP